MRRGSAWSVIGMERAEVDRRSDVQSAEDMPRHDVYVMEGDV